MITLHNCLYFTLPQIILIHQFCVKSGLEYISYMKKSKKMYDGTELLRVFIFLQYSVKIEDVQCSEI